MKHTHITERDREKEGKRKLRDRMRMKQLRGESASAAVCSSRQQLCPRMLQVTLEQRDNERERKEEPETRAENRETQESVKEIDARPLTHTHQQ